MTQWGKRLVIGVSSLGPAWWKESISSESCPLTSTHVRTHTLHSTLEGLSPRFSSFDAGLEAGRHHDAVHSARHRLLWKWGLPELRAPFCPSLEASVPLRGSGPGLSVQGRYGYCGLSGLSHPHPWGTKAFRVLQVRALTVLGPIRCPSSCERQRWVGGGAEAECHVTALRVTAFSLCL